jgi:hypothetical protein
VNGVASNALTGAGFRLKFYRELFGQLAKLIEKFASGQDLNAYLESAAGRRLLETRV